MLSYPGVTHARFALVIVGGRVIGVKIISLCYIISFFSHIQRVRFGSGVRLEPKEKIKHVLASQIIEGWANHGLLSRSRL